MSKKQSFQISLKLIQTQFNKGIQNAKKQLRSFGSFVKSAFALGTITAFGRKMVQVGSEFENAMSRVKAVTNATNREFKMMQKEAERLGATTKYTATEAANALEVLTRNGMSATQATRALSGVLQLAQANSIELANAADIVTNSLNMFGLQVDQTSRVNDVLSSTAANSATDINLLYEALVNAAPAAHVLGFSIEETSAAIGALANKGVKGANAGTALRMSLTKMADPKIIKKMNEMGVAIDEQTMKEEGLLATVKRLKDAQLSLSDLVAIFSQRGAVGVQQLINTYEDFELMLEITKNSAGTTARMFEQGVGSVQKEIATLKSKYEAFLISLSKKTSGAVKGVVRLLQNLIDNFKTVTGTVLNLSSVLVPLLTKHVTNLIKVTRTGLKAIKTDVAAVTTMMGNWIGIIMTAVTWIGTALYGAWNKAYGAVKDANKETASATAEYTRLKTQATYLINKLGPDTDKTTLAGIVKNLSEMFPEFADAIHDAAIEASKTGNWEKLKGVLTDIVALQGTILAQDTNKKLAEVNSDAAAADMYGIWFGNGVRRNMGSGAFAFQKALEEQQGLKGSQIQDIFKQATRILTGADTGESIDQFKSWLEGSGIKLSDETIYKFASEVRGSEHGKAAIEANDRVGKNESVIAAEREKVESSLTKTQENHLESERQLDEEAEKQKKIKNVQTKLDEDLVAVTDNLKHGWISNKEALKELTNAYKKAYEDLRGLKGVTGNNNKYFDKYSGLRSGDVSVLDEKIREALRNNVPAALPAITPVTGKAQGTTPGISARPTNPTQLIPSLEGTINELELITDQLGNMNTIVQSIGSAFNTLNDEEASFMDKLSASVQLMQVIPAILKTINTLTQMGTMLKKAQNAADAKGATTKVAGAIAGLFEGNSEIPIAGILIAAAGVAALIAALASAPKFATGGIVGGTSFSGDKNFARVNSGEMILNGGQQARLFNMLNGAVPAGGTHDVNFVIRGKDLYGTLKNYNDSTSKIRSNL